MRTTLFKLLKGLTDAGAFPEPIFEFGAFRAPGQEKRGWVRDYFSGKQYVGCDMRPGIGVDRIEDLHNLTLPDESIGTALLFDTVEHVRKPWHAMAELHRCLRPGGLVVMTSVMYFPIHAYPDDYWRFTGSGFASLLQDFNVVCIESCGLTKLPHTIVAVATRENFHPLLAAKLKAAVLSWKRHGADSWKEIALAAIPPILLIPAYHLYERVLERRSRRAGGGIGSVETAPRPKNR